VTHLPYVAAGYALFVLVALGLAVSSAQRLRQAAQRLRAIDLRGKDGP